ncbi:MAG: HofP DNA utilization family protein [Kluyvera sp.]|uniref:HofP DNA utilization family protein n=1 Tax=Kluyvera sp. TaxID=1538228 RepID=UPI003A84444C
MNRKRSLALIALLPLLCGMHDPFMPVDDPCHSAQLTLWRYRGLVEAGERMIAIVQRDDNQWQRVDNDTVLITGWRVIAITPETLTVAVGTGCEPQRWQWKREGTTQNEKDKSADTAASTAAQPGEKRHPDGRRRAGGAGAAKPGRP